MPQDNVELFRRGPAAWNEGDFGVIVEMCHPDVEWTFSDRLPDATRRHVVADVRFVANGPDGIEVSMQFIHVWTTRNGQIVRFRGYPTLTEALEAVSR